MSLEALDLDGNLLAGADNVESTVCEENFAELHRAISCLKPKQRNLLFKMQKLPAVNTAGSRIFTHGLLDCFIILSVHYEKNYQCAS